MKSYVDSDLSKDQTIKISTSSSIHEHDGVVFSWGYTNQSSIIDCTNGAKIKALSKGAKKTLIFRIGLELTWRPLDHTTPTYEDYNTTIRKYNKR